MARIQYRSATSASYESASRVITAGELTYRICCAGSDCGNHRSRTICSATIAVISDGRWRRRRQRPSLVDAFTPYLKSLREKIMTDAVSSSAM